MSKNEFFCTDTEERSPCIDGVPFRLEIQTDIYGEETSWSQMEGGDEIDSVSQYPLSTTIQEPGSGSSYCLDSEECFSLAIEDSVGDSLRCEFGEGSYIGYLEGEKLFEGGESGSSETQTSDLVGLVSVQPKFHLVPVRPKFQGRRARKPRTL